MKHRENGKTEIMSKEENSFIGYVHYLIEPIQSIECYIIEGWTLKDPEITLETDLEDSTIMKRD